MACRRRSSSRHPLGGCHGTPRWASVLADQCPVEVVLALITSVGDSAGWGASSRGTSSGGSSLMSPSRALIRFAHDRGLLRDLPHSAAASCEPIPRSEVQRDNVSSHP